ncbi:MAG: hypothetical protein J0M04_24390, partial [Verrucomicrobia bacterium]|nr:hypothetical protein [Verrucomicrobiota bacterium]
RLGLPGFSSHQFSVSVETELVTLADVPAESSRLYELLQTDVDRQMQQTGFVPPLDYGMVPGACASGTPQGANGSQNHATANGSAPSLTGLAAPVHANGADNPEPVPAQAPTPLDGRWKCSEKQRNLILKLVDEHQLDKHQIESLAVERFGHGVRLLDKMEASGLIDELLDTHGGGTRTRQTAARSNGSAYRGVNGRRSAA